jgi:hypothetical protein
VTDYKLNTKFDDQVYDEDRKLWEQLPRCFANVKHNGAVIRTVAGLRKFGDESQYKTDVPGGFVLAREVYLNKANGEYCSVSLFEIAKQLYFIIRSKNVSLVLRKDSYDKDLTTYVEPRYQYVLDMATAFKTIYWGLPETQRDEIDKMLLHHTMSMEFCSSKYQHIVDYGKVTLLIPFALTQFKPSSEGLTSMLPDDAQRWFEKVGLGKLSFMYCVNESDPATKNDVRNKIFNDDNSEGAVVYKIYRHAKTCEERVLQVYKYKNYKYIFWRAVREKIRAKATISRMVYRLNELHVDVPDLQTLIQRAIRFYAFCWLTETENYDNIFATWIDKMKEFDGLSESKMDEYLAKFTVIDESRQQRQIMPIGFPGSGKTSVLKSLEILIPNSIRLNQDECNKSAKLYHQKLTKLSNSGNVKYLLLDKCYQNNQVRNASYENMNIQQIVYIVFYHPDDVHFNDGYIMIDRFDGIMNLIKDRINKRGKAHLNLYPGPKLDGILDGFQKSYQFLTPQEIESAEQVIYVDVKMSLSDQVKQILDTIGIKKDKYEIKQAINTVMTDENNLRKKMANN